MAQWMKLWSHNQEVPGSNMLLCKALYPCLYSLGENLWQSVHWLLDHKYFAF